MHVMTKVRTAHGREKKVSDFLFLISNRAYRELAKILLDVCSLEC